MPHRDVEDTRATAEWELAPIGRPVGAIHAAQAAHTGCHARVEYVRRHGAMLAIAQVGRVRLDREDRARLQDARIVGEENCRRLEVEDVRHLLRDRRKNRVEGEIGDQRATQLIQRLRFDRAATCFALPPLQAADKGARHSRDDEKDEERDDVLWRADSKLVERGQKEEVEGKEAGDRYRDARPDAAKGRAREDNDQIREGDRDGVETPVVKLGANGNEDEAEEARDVSRPRLSARRYNELLLFRDRDHTVVLAPVSMHLTLPSINVV